MSVATRSTTGKNPNASITIPTRLPLPFNDTINPAHHAAAKTIPQPKPMASDRGRRKFITASADATPSPTSGHTAIAFGGTRETILATTAAAAIQQYAQANRPEGA